jgi:hypothetical protein
MTHCREEQDVGLYIPRWDNGTDYQGYRQCVRSLIFGLWANSNWCAWFGRSGWRLPVISLHQAGEIIMFGSFYLLLPSESGTRLTLKLSAINSNPRKARTLETHSVIGYADDL